MATQLGNIVDVQCNRGAFSGWVNDFGFWHCLSGFKGSFGFFQFSFAGFSNRTVYATG
ncbi:hypothetical protein D3C86_1826700 [compost metagenome]